jgi:molybdenum cofactor guanylyltransferase
VLAGGLGRRLGGSKATVELCGKPLLSYPLAALAAVLDEVAIIAKADTELPSLPGVTVWIEPQTPRHPLMGIVQALGLAGGRPVLVCAGDLPFVPPELVDELARTDPGDAPAVIACDGDSIQPLLGCYRPQALRLLRAPGPDVALRDAVAAIGPKLVQVRDREALFNVNLPEDLLAAAAILDRRRSTRYPNVKS